MSNELATKQDSALIEKVLIDGDLSQLSAQERMAYYKAVCNSIGLNPLTKPFDYIRLNNKLVLYAKRDATDQLRKIHGVSITKLERELIEGIYTVIAYASDKTTRTDTAIGAVTVANLQGDAKANAMMKAETKAKRRVTLSIVGLGWLDETEIDTIPTAQVNIVNVETGEVVEQPSPAQPVSQPTEAKVTAQQVHSATPTDIPNSPKLVIEAVAKVLGQDYYKAANHLYNAIGKYPGGNDLSGWQDYYAQALEHARLRITENANEAQAA